MGFISWIIMGLVAGLIARAILKEQGGWLSSLVVGCLGAVVGGWIGDVAFNRGSLSFWSLGSWLLAIGGSVLVLWGWSKLSRR
ncbi:MAG: GlsB/YeaQ/YmgE family stress response membrane protein [Propionibacteriaceae bacterium]|jgi:uncharacterized membrane protein YeaQ/YmgE (transglycosylase-associated protein family)|nr:GlsB/YeaQ/YmgE family stress response membrane protein [Propionibacteriaceae bacterium]